MYYRIQETDEAINDVSRISFKAYDYTRDKNSGLAFLRLYDAVVANIAVLPNGFSTTKMKYRGHEIHILPFGNYNLFFVISEPEREVIILRVLYRKQNWQQILKMDTSYHIPEKEAVR